ncbi:MAG TPA: hypothetical protein VGE01_02025, partial [Fimbriimonas sp.]
IQVCLCGKSGSYSFRRMAEHAEKGVAFASMLEYKAPVGSYGVVDDPVMSGNSMRHGLCVPLPELGAPLDVG